MSKMLKGLLAAAVVATGALALAPAADAAVRTGTLVCRVAPGVGLLFGSRRSLECDFQNRHGRTERYTGRIDRIGIDIGITRSDQIMWAVFEPTRHHGDLTGRYTGATAQATVVLGLGANVLVGGGSGSIALQPLSVSTQTGLNIAAGISSMHLTRAR
jgi:hypothetical protein